ncbi:MAG: hypothetical protein CL935_03895 [Deltaproteobacteria bacterium]|nr:hypothetical protein [Deltaproteobacteria bacterium]
MIFKFLEQDLFSRMKIFLCLVIFFSGISNAIARQPTTAELEAIRKETKIVFQSFLQLWQEERYFELYEYGKRHSKNQLSIEEFATRMVELDWVPVGLLPEKNPEMNYRYRTLLYVDAEILFRHKSFIDLQFSKKQSFLLLKEKGKWRFDLLQMIRSPFYSP